MSIARLLVITLGLAAIPAAKAKHMWVETGVDNWNETLGEDIDPVSGRPKDDALCSLREAIEAWRAARGVPQSNYLHENKNGWQNDCELKDGLATGDDTINFKPNVTQVVVDTSKWSSLSLSYLPKTGPSPGFGQVVDKQRLEIRSGVQPGSFADVTISPAPGSKKSLFVMNGGGDLSNPASDAYKRVLVVTLTGLTFKGAKSEESGGVIRAAMSPVAYLNVMYSRFVNNDAFPVNDVSGGEANGGAISSSGGTVHIHRSFFRNNSATHGGALDLGSGTYSIWRNLFYKNAADRGGGAISCHGALELPIGLSTFEYNFAEGEGPPGNYHGGGAISSDCGLLLYDSVFALNDVLRGGLGGGAIYAPPASGYLDIQRSLFAFNQVGSEGKAFPACAGDVEERCSGGALRLGAQSRVDRSAFVANINYGGIEGFGGAIAANGVGMDIEGSKSPVAGVFNSHFYLNVATHPGFIDLDSAGAAIAMFGSGRYYISGSTFVSNGGDSQLFAAPSDGGDLAVFLNNSIVAGKASFSCDGPVGSFRNNVDSVGNVIVDSGGNAVPNGGGNLQSNDSGLASCVGVDALPFSDIPLQFEDGGFTVTAAESLSSVSPVDPGVNSLGKLRKYSVGIYRPENKDGPLFYTGYPPACQDADLQRGKDLLGVARPVEACTPGAIEIGGDSN